MAAPGCQRREVRGHRGSSSRCSNRCGSAELTPRACQRMLLGRLSKAVSKSKGEERLWLAVRMVVHARLPRLPRWRASRSRPSRRSSTSGQMWRPAHACIERVMAEHAYVMNHSARARRRGSNGQIDFVVPTLLNNEYAAEILRDVEEALAPTEMRVTLATTLHGADRQRQWVRRVADRATDGSGRCTRRAGVAVSEGTPPPRTAVCSR